ncbi:MULTISPECIES: CDP-diacylglycerol--serine O-phosphatidyltransferase [Actinopolyspora]|uniref:CDP-diacylglycerol--serine O-phosphatidyltransferase n=1 Tax=Actinopolyspora saharensis TaxID=995062 RepID=A0A1H1EYR5_9ACTN|nr:MULTISPECIES: CDP-diacylglycerol--serine O-phosphatidyltransferase [Actinopolyspora]NHD18284.1 CDP-diacylglycerol--serine O-phosphatidyltransferase [Actinopolyspora sp. BKK2]NHE77037.1 CDP-diacylglycerol--serine O-phosphatidyltransferase [Actinopolyspora sp. BKK1]SDQ93788.1 CDP-diacylglycerol---serine O-phosphatidyltransferase [Actinopolyspora saharensis]
MSETRSNPPGVRFLPNAVTVLAMCAGLSAVQFALNQQLEGAIAATAVAAVLDGLDGRIARLLDATSKMGAELDSLSDAMSFGVAPALTLYAWQLAGNRVGWVVALVFAVCMILRLARFNTLLDDGEQPSFSKEFFVGVPAPAAGLLALLPIVITAAAGGDGWWSAQPTVMVWMLAIAALAVSRVPTLSLKTVKVPAKLVAPLLVLVALLAAGIVTYPLISLTIALAGYLVHVPYAVYRHHWLANHPEAWEVPPRERRAIRRSQRRLGLRPPLRRRVAGAARRVRLPRRNGDRDRENRRSYRALGLRHRSK